MQHLPVPIISNGDMSQSTVLSTGIYLDQLVAYAIQAIFSGSPNGTFMIQVSNDIVSPMNRTPGANASSQVVNWTDYTASSYAITEAGDVTWNVALAGYSWVRLKYTKSSGSGTLNATFVGKG